MLGRVSRWFPTVVLGGICLVMAAARASAGPSGLGDHDRTSAQQEEPTIVRCEPFNGGLELPEGFCALVVADDLGQARDLTVNDRGDLYVRLREPESRGSILVLQDTTGDGKADQIRGFGTDEGGTGIELRDRYLYVATRNEVYRYRLRRGELVPSSSPEAFIVGLPERRQHAAKRFVFDNHGSVFVNIGAPANACQKEGRTAGSPGLDPCPLLEEFGGIWRFATDAPLPMNFEDGTRYATGIRHAFAMSWHPEHRSLYATQHGRDQLHGLWPDSFTVEQSAELPSEELLRIDDGSNFGWPYCYYDHLQGKRILAPEYGGDGNATDRCAGFDEPLLGFPGHWGPNDLLFYDGEQFPERYRGGAFIAFHGSWNRAPLPQAGYKVVFVPFADGRPSGDYETFAGGFAGTAMVAEPTDARFRPTGLAEGPDGSLYIADSEHGRIWRVMVRDATKRQSRR